MYATAVFCQQQVAISVNFSVHARNVNVKRKSRSRAKAHRAAMISRFLNPQDRHQVTLRDHGYGVSAPRGVPIFTSAFALLVLIVPIPTEGWPG